MIEKKREGGKWPVSGVTHLYSQMMEGLWLSFHAIACSAHNEDSVAFPLQSASSSSKKHHLMVQENEGKMLAFA